jgi:hypothetical protein
MRLLLLGVSTGVIAAMDNHTNHSDIQPYGCWFLTRLLKANEDYRNKILDGEGLVPVVEAQRVHKHDADVVQAAQKAHDAIIANS